MGKEKASSQKKSKNNDIEGHILERINRLLITVQVKKKCQMPARKI